MDAGTSISSGAAGASSVVRADCSVAISVSSAPENVNHGENNHPDGIHEMPVHGKHSDARGLILTDAARQTEDQHDAEHEQARP